MLTRSDFTFRAGACPQNIIFLLFYYNNYLKKSHLHNGTIAMVIRATSICLTFLRNRLALHLLSARGVVGRGPKAAQFDKVTSCLQRL
jgi:hypothetical protein